MIHASRTVLTVSVAFLFLITVSIAKADTLTFSGARDMTVQATGPTGAVANFSVNASDASSTSVAVTCVPPSGSTFPLGTTTVNCEAADSTGATSTARFGVGVVDTTPPSITAPADQAFATSTFPAYPTLRPATATDLVDLSPRVTYSPVSFNAGTTTVVWTATDASGNSATTSSLVIITDTSASSTATSSSPVATSTNPTASSTIDIAVQVSVPAACTATDTADVAHVYPDASSTSSYLGICALEAALGSGAISNVGLSNQYPSLGLFVTEINGVTADPSSQYWALYQNGAMSSVGISQMTVVASDTIQFQLHDFADNDLGDHLTLFVDSLLATSTATSTPQSSPTSVGGGGGGSITHHTLNIASALSYLSSQQVQDGSFGSDMITDWVAIAFATQGSSTAKTAIERYLLTANPTMSSVTDYERHAIALEDYGINPYSGTGENYIAPIVASFDGTQLGDPSLVNDDIFGVLALSSAGYAPSDSMMEKITDFIISKQKVDGSWDESPDMTAAALQVLPAFFVGTNVSPAALGQALGAGETYLINSQQFDGSWGNVDSTSWVQTFINAVNADDPTNARIWTSSGGYLPTDAIAAAQQADGGVGPTSETASSRIWSTAYAIVAASGSDWDNVQKQFPQPAQTVTFAGGGGGPLAIGVDGAASTTATSTTFTLATSTPAAASSTLGSGIASTTFGFGTSSAPIVAPIQKSLRYAVAKAGTIAQYSHTATRAKLKSTFDLAAASPNTHATPTQLPHTQLAGAAASGGGFLIWVWHATTSFFGSLLKLL